MRIRASSLMPAGIAAALLLLLSPPDPSALAARLGARSAQEREEAAAELVALVNAVEQVASRAELRA